MMEMIDSQNKVVISMPRYYTMYGHIISFTDEYFKLAPGEYYVRSTKNKRNFYYIRISGGFFSKDLVIYNKDSGNESASFEMERPLGTMKARVTDSYVARNSNVHKRKNWHIIEIFHPDEITKGIPPSLFSDSGEDADTFIARNTVRILALEKNIDYICKYNGENYCKINVASSPDPEVVAVISIKKKIHKNKFGDPISYNITLSELLYTEEF